MAVSGGTQLESIRMEFIDTQVLSYAHKGAFDDTVDGRYISSITANEFLASPGRTAHDGSLPYPPWGATPRIALGTGGGNRPEHPFNRHTTDRIVMDFGGQFPAIIEYGNLAVSEVINERANDVFPAAIDSLEKDQRQLLRRRFSFIQDAELWCRPVSREGVWLAYRLLDEFIKHHNVKKNFRNTWNDLLILATAMEASGHLTTKDSELSRFVSESRAGRLLSPG